MNDIDRMRFESLQDSYDSLKQQLAEVQRKKRELEDEVLYLEFLTNVR